MYTQLSGLKFRCGHHIRRENAKKVFKLFVFFVQTRYESFEKPQKQLIDAKQTQDSTQLLFHISFSLIFCFLPWQSPRLGVAHRRFALLVKDKTFYGGREKIGSFSSVARSSILHIFCLSRGDCHLFLHFFKKFFQSAVKVKNKLWLIAGRAWLFTLFVV